MADEPLDSLCIPENDGGSGRDSSPEDPVAMTGDSWSGCTGPWPVGGEDAYTLTIAAGERLAVYVTPADCPSEGSFGGFDLYLDDHWVGFGVADDACRWVIRSATYDERLARIVIGSFHGGLYTVEVSHAPDPSVPGVVEDLSFATERGELVVWRLSIPAGESAALVSVGWFEINGSDLNFFCEVQDAKTGEFLAGGGGGSGGSFASDTRPTTASLAVDGHADVHLEAEFESNASTSRAADSCEVTFPAPNETRELLFYGGAQAATARVDVEVELATTPGVTILGRSDAPFLVFDENDWTVRDGAYVHTAAASVASVGRASMTVPATSGLWGWFSSFEDGIRLGYDGPNGPVDGDTFYLFEFSAADAYEFWYEDLLFASFAQAATPLDPCVRFVTTGGSCDRNPVVLVVADIALP